MRKGRGMRESQTKSGMAGQAYLEYLDLTPILDDPYSPHTWPMSK
jgi:hypothetical protein